ncbi:MAG: hypothetical protein QM635_10920 [Microbacteriaceae bacterium]
MAVPGQCAVDRDRHFARVPAARTRLAAGEAIDRALDHIGLLLLAPALGALLLGLSNIATKSTAASPEVLGPLACGAVPLAAFVGWGSARSSSRR